MRLVDVKFWGNFGTLPCFGKVIILASFQEDGKSKAEINGNVGVLDEAVDSLEFF
jgi:hypothetical protein